VLVLGIHTINAKEDVCVLSKACQHWHLSILGLTTCPKVLTVVQVWGDKKT